MFLFLLKDRGSLWQAAWSWQELGQSLLEATSLPSSGSPKKIGSGNPAKTKLELEDCWKCLIWLKIIDQWRNYSEHVWHLHRKTIHRVQFLPGNHHQGSLASHMSQSQQGRAGTAENFSVSLNVSQYFLTFFSRSRKFSAFCCISGFFYCDFCTWWV